MNYFKKARCISLLNNNIIEKSKLIYLITTLLLIPLVVNLTVAQPFRKDERINGKGNPCNCQPTEQYPEIPPESDLDYIKNGGFECYDWFSPYEGYESDEARKYEQIECAIGGIEWGEFMEVPKDENRLVGKDAIPGWYSPTYYTPNYFNNNDYAGLRIYFNIGRNWLNYHYDEENDEVSFKYRKRYPRGWNLQNDLPNANNSNNYGYAGFWAEPAKGKNHRSIWNEYIQQKLKYNLLPGHRYLLSCNISKNLTVEDHDKNGSQNIGFYFSQTPPHNFYNEDYPRITDDKFNEKEQIIAYKFINFPPPQDINYYNPFNISIKNDNRIDYGENLFITNNVISDCPDINGMGGWYHYEREIQVDEACSYITIGLFNYNSLAWADPDSVTAYYIDDVHIIELEDCSCEIPTHDWPFTPESPVQIKIVPSGNCCWNFFFHSKLEDGCEIQSIDLDITFPESLGFHLTDSYSGFTSKNDFTFGPYCLTPYDRLIFENQKAIFTFTYNFGYNTSCQVSQRLKLECQTSCTCPSIPNPITLVRRLNEPCCYDILLQLNQVGQLSNYCKYFKAEIYEKPDVGPLNPYSLLFTSYPNADNCVIDPIFSWKYFYPGSTINLTNGINKICFNSEFPTTKSIRVKLWKFDDFGNIDTCSYITQLEGHCKKSCEDIKRNPNIIDFLKCILIPKPKGPLVTKCIYEVHIINNTGFDISIPEFKYDFSSVTDSLPEFRRTWLTNFDSIAITFPTSPTDWTFLKDTNNQSISFTTSPIEFVLADGDTLHLADISIPESDEALAVGFNIKNSQDLNSYCDFGEEIISCPKDSVCSCEVSSLLDFTLTEKKKATASDPCCYEISLSPPSQYLNCAINEIEVYVKNPGDTIYSVLPDIDTLLLTPLNNKLTLTRDICINPVDDNSSFSVKVKFKNLNFECEKEQKIDFTQCPCVCDEDGLNFTLTSNPDESCCYTIWLDSDCPRTFSEINLEFPDTLNNYLDESYFSSVIYGIKYEKQGNNYNYSPERPIRISNNSSKYLGKFCLPTLPQSIDRPIAITLTAKNEDSTVCKEQIINIDCSCCDSATVIVDNTNGCCWDISCSNSFTCLVNPINPKVSIIDKTEGIHLVDSVGFIASLDQLCLLRGQSKTIEIDWLDNGYQLCSKIITLSCSYAGIGSIAGGDGGIIPKIALPFSDINNGIIKNFEFAPNPASDDANIRFDLLKEIKTLKLEIYDSKGDLIANIPIANYIKGQNYINLNTSNIIAGSYYLVLQTENAKMCLPIRIVR